MTPPLPAEPRLAALLHRCAFAARLLGVTIPSSVLAGWMFDVEPLKRIVPGLVAMNPLSAANFLLCSLTLAILRRKPLEPGWRRLAQGAAFAVALTAFLKLAGLVCGFDLGLDRLLFHDKLDLDPVLPNRMAPTTALNFLLLGAGLLLVDTETRRGGRPAQFLALAVAVIAALAFIGYLYGVRGLTGLARYIPMALHTAVVFMALAGDLLCARLGCGWMARVTGAGVGGTMIRRVMFVVTGAPLLLGWLILAGEQGHFYNAEFAYSLLVIAVIVVFSTVIWMNAHSLDRKEAERLRAGEALHQAHRELEDRVRQRTGELSQALNEIGEGIAVLSDSAREILDSSTRLAAGAAHTASALIETTTTVEEVRQTAHLSNGNAQAAAAAARAGADISEAGRRATEDMRAGMEGIRGQMQAVEESMGRLSDRAQAIGRIVSVVEELAAQSNLLAVNAAIEASKAGEYGRGFTVVAHEVRFLAEQSKGATAQVRKILSDIQTAVNAAVERTGRGSEAVAAGVGQCHHAGEAILALAASVAQSAEAATQLAAASRQEMLGMDQVVVAMTHIKEASAASVVSARQLEAAAGRLDQLGSNLKNFAAQPSGGG